MSTSSSLLRILVAIVGVFLVVAAVKSGQWLFALGLACFFGFAFSALSFSSIDPSATDPSSGRWFLVAAGFGLVGFVAVASLFVLSLIDGNSKNAIRTGGGLILVVSVCWNKRAELAAAIKRNLNSPSASDEPGKRPSSHD